MTSGEVGSAQESQELKMNAKTGLGSYVLWDPGEVGAEGLWGCHDTAST